MIGDLLGNFHPGNQNALTFTYKKRISLVHDRRDRIRLDVTFFEVVIIKMEHLIGTRATCCFLVRK